MAKKEASKYLGSGSARHAAKKLGGRRQRIDDAVDEAMSGAKSEKKRKKGNRN